jgi:hypothetical protein
VFENIEFVYIDCVSTLETRTCKLTNMGVYEKMNHKMDRINTMAQLTLPKVKQIYYCLKTSYFISTNIEHQISTSDNPLKIFLQKNELDKSKSLIVTYDIELRTVLTSECGIKANVLRKSDYWFSFIRAKSILLDKESIQHANQSFSTDSNYSLIIDGNNLFYHLLPTISREDKMKANNICTHFLYAFWKRSKQLQDIVIIYDKRTTEPIYEEDRQRKFVVSGPMMKKKTADDEIIRYIQEEANGKKTYLVTDDAALIGRASHQNIYGGHINCGQLLDIAIDLLSKSTNEFKTKLVKKWSEPISSDKVERWVLENLHKWEAP